MYTNELTGFAKVLADWTQQVTKLNHLLADHDDIGNCIEELNTVAMQMQSTAAMFEQLMDVDASVPPEKGRVLFCAAPQLGTVIGRTIGNGDARYDVRLANGCVITVAADFIGGTAEALTAWRETCLALPSPDGKR
jgi:hypothetical protein